MSCHNPKHFKLHGVYWTPNWSNVLCHAFLTDVVSTREMYPICMEDVLQACLTLVVEERYQVLKSLSLSLPLLFSPPSSTISPFPPSPPSPSPSSLPLSLLPPAPSPSFLLPPLPLLPLLPYPSFPLPSRKVIQPPLHFKLRSLSPDSGIRPGMPHT